IQASSFSSVASAACTAAIERGRPIASGTTVSGNSVVFCNGNTANSNGSPGVVRGSVAGRAGATVLDFLGDSGVSVLAVFFGFSGMVFRLDSLSGLLATQTDYQKSIAIVL